jgi:hypothetical protein
MYTIIAIAIPLILIGLGAYGTRVLMEAILEEF